MDTATFFTKGNDLGFGEQAHWGCSKMEEFAHQGSKFYPLRKVSSENGNIMYPSHQTTVKF